VLVLLWWPRHRRCPSPVNQTLVKDAARAVGSYFAPFPYIKEPADERIWGANGVLVARPAPLAGRALGCGAEGDQSACADPEMLSIAALLTARVSVAHGASLDGRYSLTFSTHDRLRLSTAPLMIAANQAGLPFITSLASMAGLTQPRLRSNQAWVGGKSPLGASLALPDTSHLPAQLADFMAFLHGNQASSSREAVEALAYQFLTIHPLADGNGRVARALLLKLAMRTRSTYPLYFAWRLMFDKLRTSSNWAKLAATGKPQPDPRHHNAWVSAARVLGESCEEAIFKGVDTRVVNALLLYGQVTLGTVQCASSGCTPALAQKILTRHGSAEHAALLNRLEKEVGRSIDELRSAVTC